MYGDTALILHGISYELGKAQYRHRCEGLEFAFQLFVLASAVRYWQTSKLNRKPCAGYPQPPNHEPRPSKGASHHGVDLRPFVGHFYARKTMRGVRGMQNMMQ